ncbi:MAG: hypothetical protein AAFQ15_06765 [Pseudomonadota bacterium]
MLLRRITKHVKDQNWFAVGIDFFIVVIGVFFGIQIGNWNDARLDYLAYQKAYTRMVVEVQTNIAEIERALETASPILENFQNAIEDVRSCRIDPEARARIDEAIKALNKTIAPVFQNNAISQLTTSERLLEQQHSGSLERYAKYARSLDTFIEWSGNVRDKMEGRSDDLHPGIEYGELRASSEESAIGGDRPLIISGDLNELCKDHEFRKMFYNWEGGTTYQFNLLGTFIEVSEEFLEELGEPTTAEVQP